MFKRDEVMNTKEEVIDELFTKYKTILDKSSHHRKCDKILSHSYYEGNEDKYIYYDNFDAIDVQSVNDIPMDYKGMMGVPITFLDKYNPSEFDIVGIGSGKMGAQMGVKENHEGKTDVTYTINGKSKSPYFRVIIINKNPISKELIQN